MNKQLLQLISSIFQSRTYYLRIAYDGRFSLKLSSEDVYIREKQKEFEDLLSEKIDPEEFIKTVLSHYTDFNYIVFQSLISERFVQFASINQELILDFPLASQNKDRKVTVSLIRLLKEYGFKEPKNLKIPINPKEFSRRQAIKMKVINADFGEDIEETADFVKSIFSKIYNLPLNQITVILG